MKAEKPDLLKVLGPKSRVYNDTSSLRVYSIDQGEVPRSLRKRLIPQTEPDVAVQPGSVEDLQAVIRYGLEKNIALVPRGASTFGMGGAVPHQGGILLDFSANRIIHNYDASSGTLRVSSGCRWPDADQFLEKHGMEVCSYPTSWFSTIGGWAATGGIGIGCTRFGNFHGLIREMTVVLPNGEIRRLTADDSEMRFYLGTEGQMGAIWDLTFQVRKRSAARKPVLLLFDSANDAVVCAQELLGRFAPYHMKYLSASRLHEINHLLREEHPQLRRDHEMPEKQALLLCLEESGDGASRYVDFRSWAQANALMPITDYRAHYLWRERMFPLRVKRVAPGLLASEVVMPAARVAEYASKAEELGRRFHVQITFECYFMNDGTALCLPVYNFTGGNRVDESVKASFAFVLTQAGIRLGGRPYGIGIWNSPFLKHKFGEELSRYAAFKKQQDPLEIFNPGKFFRMAFRGGLSTRIYALPLHHSVIPAWTALMPVIAPLLTRDVNLRRPEDMVLLNEELCSKCGSCIPVCPAYIETKDERTTARGKLQIAKLLMNGERLSNEEAGTLFLCMHCSACTDVCQSRLNLVPVWDELEQRIESRFGKDVARVGSFVESVEKKKIMGVPYARGAQISAGHQSE